MVDFYEAYVLRSTGEDFVCRIAKLTTSSLTLRDAPALEPGENVTVTFFSVWVDGRVFFADEEEVVVHFTAREDVLEQIGERIRELHGYGKPSSAIEDATTASHPVPDVELAEALTSPSASDSRTDAAPVPVPATTVNFREQEETTLPTTEPGGVPPLFRDDDTLETTDEFLTADLSRTGS